MKLARLRGILAAFALLAATGVQAASVLFITTGNVPPGKFRVLADVAGPYGFDVEVRYAEKLPADADAGLFKDRAAVFFDSYQQDYVRGKLVRALPGLKAPHVWLYEGHPTWDGLPEPVAKRLIAYYANGSRANFDGFFRTLAAQLAGRSLAGIPDPIVFPKSAVYHPKAPGLVFADPAAYFKWKGIDPMHRPPTVGIALHQQYIAAEQTAFVDDLIARIEAAGAVALPFYGPVMEAGALTRMTTLDGKPVADVIINTQIMLNPEGRRKEFEALGIPVIQAMPYRKGDTAAWAANPQGVALMDVPFYLAQSEYAGVADIQVAAAQGEKDGKAGEQLVPIAPQAASMVAKALNLVRLQRLPNAEKKLAIFFWNYPPGEKNLTASFLNLPQSLRASLTALQAEGYATTVPGDRELVNLLQRLLAPFYRDGELDALLRDDLAALLPMRDYRAWLATLPAGVGRELVARWGEPEKSALAIRRGGEYFFVIPRLKLGNVALLPQSPRGERWEDKETALYHSIKAGPSHFYLAAYLWARQQQRADALVHYGTHGSQEWLPGKERGLSVYDYPMLAVGDVPVIYPYIVDDIGEAIQAKRRGRAVIISHQTPPFAPAGLHDELTRMHDLLHAWLAQDEGAVKEKLKADLIAMVVKERIEKDMGWSTARMTAEFPAFIDSLHSHLHELAETAQPLGLHTFGAAPLELHRLGTVLLMLGRPFWEAAAAYAGVAHEDVDEALVGNYDKLAATTPYRLLQRHVIDNEATDRLPVALRDDITRARKWYTDIGAAGEQPALLAALAGRYLPTSYGGDPIKNPDAYPTGRNLYGFDPSRIPTPQAWAAGKDALENLLAAHRAQSGKTPKKLTFSLWSVETMRHMGLLEAQALWAFGVEPVWDAGGRVTGVKLIPRETLGRPRVDIVLSVTGLYRDHFPNVMKLLAEAARLAAEANEADNPVAANAKRIATMLGKRGVDPMAARRAGQTRIFSSESGRYGTGLDDATLATDTWKDKAEGDRKLAQLYLSRMQFAFGSDEAEWGKAGAGKVTDINLYAEHLKGTEGAVLSRTSNLYGMLTTDDPFQYLGGIALAVRHLDGKAPELYISNLRGNGSGKVDGAAQFLAKELATRQFHPGYIKGLMAEGYSGTLQVLGATNNLWGWTAVAREIVRDDQWQAMMDVYVRDKHKLGLKDWFERENPHALAQTIERMLEAARQEYWHTDAATIAELKERYRELAKRYDVRTDNARLQAYVGMAGFGLGAVSPAPTFAARQVAQAAAPAVPPQITGMKLEQVPPQVIQALGSLLIATITLLIAFPLVGAWRQWMRREVA